MISTYSQRLFSITSEAQFQQLTLEAFRFQYHNNAIYQTYCNHLGKHPNQVAKSQDIPFLPIQFFKSHTILSSTNLPQTIFESSGTTQSSTSKHYVTDLELYRQSFFNGFKEFYGNIEDYCILALLPSYLEREGSSLVYMVDELVKRSKHADSGFYLYDLETLKQKLLQLESNQNKTLLIGVSFALLDLAEKFPIKLKHTSVMETGGMKGRRKELIREELHDILKNAFGISHIHSEYGMTELLSQGYSKGNGIFNTPKWMKVLTRDTEDPLSPQPNGKTGGINVIDLANINSCCFIATQDLGKTYKDGSFEVLGRFDHSDVRGCNLMAL
ncbi:LuxE/PaaK family acyltransferase [Flagellimonas flava]|uniref:Acyl-protein synthetase, LuxE n=1 Tax=Flagellimonas flava TaxID=570519 RepID=A0A1M5KCV3_9FLAO|nr:acyl transferase [Allomuricauda flava]SHG50578.1 Acyl-protein synthetase, LuxE [Allomuricauda flava]